MNITRRYSNPAATPTSWDLFREFDDLFNQMHGGTAEQELRVATDIRENDTGYLMTFDVPGMKDSDIKVDIKDGTLTVSGERKSSTSENGEGWTRRERSFGRFSRSFSLPKEVDASKIEAQVEHGELQLFLPKGELAQPKSIPVRNGAHAGEGQVKGLMDRFFAPKEKTVPSEKH